VFMDMAEGSIIIIIIVAACNAETCRLLYVILFVCFFFVFFVCHAGNKIDQLWQQISRRRVGRRGRNFPDC